MVAQTENIQNTAGRETEKFLIHPVGFVHSELKEPSLKAGKDGLDLQDHVQAVKQQFRKIQSMVCELEIDSRFNGILDGIDGFSHILVLYWAHRVDPKRRNLTQVHPMGRKDIPAQGIFATCSPARPNPVLVTAVRLLERCGNILRVQGLEAVDGSPIIDIKPYNPMYYHMENPRVPEWMSHIQHTLEENTRT